MGFYSRDLKGKGINVMYISNDDRQNYPFKRPNFLLKRFDITSWTNQSRFGKKVPKVSKPLVEKNF